MSRAPAATDTVVVKPSNNVYTALAVVATVVAAIGIVIIFVQAKALFGNGLM